jgi:BirA family transcriptional regulator, biotin operon repressor / biotin---[acetyl-CoA-carboxylase] ligase
MFDLSTIGETPGLAGLEFQPEIDSTNAWALRTLHDDSRALPLLFLTQQQTAGRGRGSNVWWSAPGALTFSLLVNTPSDPRLALVTGVAVCEALAACFAEGIFALKWPNDVYLNQRKVCGILVESPAQSGRRTIIGVGINVNNSFHTAPPELLTKATSMVDVAGGSFDMNEVLRTVVQRILHRVQQFSTGENSFDHDFRRYCLLTQKEVSIQSGRETISGRCEGIAADGSLLVRTEQGLRTMVSGVVSFEF